MSGADDIDWSTVRFSAIGSTRQRWPSEVRDLTPWVLENLDELGRELGMRLKPVGREFAVGTFRADIAARDSSGRLVIIENQFGPSDHSHFGQIVLYALEAKADVVVWLVASDVRMFISGGLRPEHRRAVQQLNDVFAGKIEFYGIEVRLESEPRLPGEPDTPVLPRLDAVVRPRQILPE